MQPPIIVYIYLIYHIVALFYSVVKNACSGLFRYPDIDAKSFEFLQIARLYPAVGDQAMDCGDRSSLGEAVVSDFAAVAQDYHLRSYFDHEIGRAHV
jgi:hypothetical protein